MPRHDAEPAKAAGLNFRLAPAVNGAKTTSSLIYWTGDAAARRAPADVMRQALKTTGRAHENKRVATSAVFDARTPITRTSDRDYGNEENTALTAFVASLWAELHSSDIRPTPPCPHCGAANARLHQRPNQYHSVPYFRCGGCGKLFTRLTGSPLARLRFVSKMPASPCCRNRFRSRRPLVACRLTMSRHRTG